MALLFAFWLILYTAPMGTTAVTWFGTLDGVMLAIMVGLATAWMIRLKNRQRPGSTAPRDPPRINWPGELGRNAAKLAASEPSLIRVWDTQTLIKD